MGGIIDRYYSNFFSALTAKRMPLLLQRKCRLPDDFEKRKTPVSREIKNRSLKVYQGGNAG